jgi:hypothetical protein
MFYGASITLTESRTIPETVRQLIERPDGEQTVR